MQKLHKSSRLQKQRERTLKVCLPHVIKDKNDVEDLFVGDYCVKLPRQSSRSCHVVFPNVKEKLKNYKLAKNKMISGKRVLIKPLHDLALRKETEKVKKVKKKKIFIPKIEPDIKVTQSIFIGNIPLGTKTDEIKAVLPGCSSVTLLRPYNKDFRSAIVKMETIQIASEYLKKERESPTLRGHKLIMKLDTRTKYRKKKVSDSTIKVYDGDAMHCKSSDSCKSSDCIEGSDESS